MNSCPLLFLSPILADIEKYLTYVSKVYDLRIKSI